MQENKQLDYATWFFFFSICFFRHARSPPPSLQSPPPPSSFSPVSSSSSPISSINTSLLFVTASHTRRGEPKTTPQWWTLPSDLSSCSFNFYNILLIINKHLFCRCIEVAADIVHHVRHPTYSFVSWEEELNSALPSRPAFWPFRGGGLTPSSSSLYNLPTYFWHQSCHLVLLMSFGATVCVAVNHDVPSLGNLYLMWALSF